MAWKNLREDIVLLFVDAAPAEVTLRAMAREADAIVCRSTHGVCRDCGRPVEAARLCLLCNRKQIVRLRALRARYRAAGLCTACGAPPAAPGKRLCRAHADKYLANFHARKDRAVARP